MAESKDIAGEPKEGRRVRKRRQTRERIEQAARRFWYVADRVSGASKISGGCDHARRYVEADRIAGAARCARIIRHQDRDPSRLAWRGAQRH